MKPSFVAMLLACLALAPAAPAQTVGATLRGTVTDAAGKARAAATVSLVNEETNERRQASSGAAGEYLLSVLPPGSYRVEAESSGFRRFVATRVTLAVGQTVRLDIPLQAGAPGQEVVVTAVQPLVKSDASGVGTLIGNRQIANLPLDGRNFLQLSLLAPGAAPAAQGSPGSVRGEFTVNVNGAREDANNFLLDGVYNVDPKLNTFAINPPVDAIREFEILTSSYDASFGRNGGAQVNVALKSGTNRLRGTVYEFLRNAALDARNFFARAEDGPPQYQRNQFGFSLGGPIRQDRTFFFVDYEGRRLREGITRVTNVPTDLERAGDFSKSTLRPIDPFTRQPFPNDRIPATRQSAVGAAIALLYPHPNRSVAGLNFVSSPALRDRDDRFDLRIDHALAPSSDLVARYSLSDRDLYEPFSGPSFALVPGFGTSIPRRAQNVMLGENHTFSATLINEARVAFNRIASRSTHENAAASINRKVGLPELSSNPRDQGLSFITVSGFSPLGDEYNNPQASVTNTLQLLDNVTLVRGRNLIKAGVEYRSLQQNAFRDVQSRGFLTFSDFGQVTGNGLADLLLGYPYLAGGARLDNHQQLRSRMTGFYAQDSIRLRRNLNLLLGVRYEYATPAVDRLDRANVYDPATGRLAAVGQNGIPRAGYEPDRNNWAPRIGMAWSPGASARTVVHAGYGVYYDQLSLAPGEGLYFNAPYYDFKLYFSLPGFPLTLADPFPAFFPYPLPGSAFGFDRNLRTAYFQHWNLKVERQLGANRLVDLGYVGSKGSKIRSGRDVNQPRPSVVRPNLRPNPAFDDVTLIESRSGSTYHSLQLRFQQRFQSGITMLSSYTWAKSLDDASTFFSSAGDSNFPQDSGNVAAEKGPSNFDVRHRLSLSYAYDLPFGRGRRLLANRGWLSAALSGWSTQEIVTLQSGRPFTVAIHPDIDNSNTGRSILGFGFNDRPNRIGDGALGDPTPEKWFDTAKFVYPAFGSFGNSGRNVLRGPAYRDVSFSLIKTSTLREGLDLQFRTEFFNLFNNTNFDLPDIFLGSPSFGRVQSAESPRRIQFGLKLLF